MGSLLGAREGAICCTLLLDSGAFELLLSREQQKDAGGLWTWLPWMYTAAAIGWQHICTGRPSRWVLSLTSPSISPSPGTVAALLLPIISCAGGVGRGSLLLALCHEGSRSSPFC